MGFIRHGHQMIGKRNIKKIRKIEKKGDDVRKRKNDKGNDII